ncbi:MAG: hypothetical protein WBL70_10965 [Candidatus Acidiferrales bacterium]
MRQAIVNQIVAVMLAFGMLVDPTVNGQTLTTKQSPITFVRDFLRMAYPDLAGKDLFLKITTGQSIDNTWREIYGIEFVITPFDHVESNPPVDAHTGKPVPVPENRAILGGGFLFNDRGELEEMNAGEFDFVNGSRNQAMETLIESHPEWTDEEDYRRLEAAGALYAPADRDKFVQSVHLERFESLMGPLRIESVEFNGIENEVHAGQFAPLSFAWTVKADASAQEGTPRICFFSYEPFEGKLTHVKCWARKL